MGRPKRSATSKWLPERRQNNAKKLTNCPGSKKQMRDKASKGMHDKCTSTWDFPFRNKSIEEEEKKLKNKKNKKKGSKQTVSTGQGQRSMPSVNLTPMHLKKSQWETRIYWVCVCACEHKCKMWPYMDTEKDTGSVKLPQLLSITTIAKSQAIREHCGYERQ